MKPRLFYNTHKLSEAAGVPRSRIEKALRLQVIIPDGYIGNSGFPIFNTTKLPSLMRAVRGPLAGPIGRAFNAGFSTPSPKTKPCTA